MPMYLRGGKFKVNEVFAMEIDNKMHWVIYLAVRSAWPFYLMDKNNAYANVKKFIGSDGAWTEVKDDHYLGCGGLAPLLDAIAAREALILMEAQTNAQRDRRHLKESTLKKDSADSLVSGSTTGSLHWFITLLSEQSRTGEYLSKKTPDEATLRNWGSRIQKISKELMSVIEDMPAVAEKS